MRDYLDRERFEQLLSAKGISNDTTVVFYGDKNNWWATYALWVFKLFGHQDARILNGGRAKWIAEGRDLTKEVPSYSPARYQATQRDDGEIRAFRDQVLDHIRESGTALVDVRSPQEYSVGSRFAQGVTARTCCTAGLGSQRQRARALRSTTIWATSMRLWVVSGRFSAICRMNIR